MGHVVSLQMGDLGAAAFAQLDRFTQGYIETMFWTAGYLDEREGPVLSFEQLDPGALDQIKTECEKFQRENTQYLMTAYAQSGYDANKAGYDFFLTRCGHGAGFWDRKELEVLTPTGNELGTVLSERARAAGERNCYTDVEIHDPETGARNPDVDPSDAVIYYN